MVKSRSHRKPSLADRLIGYCGGLPLVGGDHDGEMLEVLPWERRFIRGAFRVRGDSALSVARGNGKTGLVGALACAVADPDGPLHGNRREVVCVASSFGQGRLIFEDALATLREAKGGLKRGEWRVQDSANTATVEHRPSGARIRCIGSDPKRAHGLRPALALLDEPAQWPPATAERMLAAIRTGLGKVPGSRLVALGTRPANGDHWFARMLAGGAAYAQIHAARPDDPPFRARTVRRANPSFDHLPSLQARLELEQREAKLDAGLLASWKALRLNMGVADAEVSVLLEADVWRRIELPEAAGELQGPCVWGADLGTSAAQSAIAAYWPQSGVLRCVAAFPAEPSLAERGLADGVGRLYTECARRGELLTLGRRSVDVGGLLAAGLARFGRPVAVAADRWRADELRDAMDAANFPRRVGLVERGMGYQDGAADVRAFRRSCLNGRVLPEPSLLLRSAMAEARTISDASGNHKLAKGSEGGRRFRARDDAAAAGILAVSLGAQMPDRPARRWRVV